MSSPDVVLILIDPNANILTYPDGTNYSFVTTTLTMPDYPWDKNTDMAAKNASLRILRDRFGFIINRARLYDASVVNTLGVKTFVYIYKIDASERARLALIPSIVFSSINALPPNLNFLSAAVANVLTSNFNLIRDAPAPANILLINYPPKVNIYTPSFSIPVLIPYIVYVKGINQPVLTAPIVKRNSPIVKRNSPVVETVSDKKSNKPNSPVVPRTPIKLSLSSSSSSESPKKEYKPTVSTSNSSSPKNSSPPKDLPKRNSPKKNSPKSKIPSPKKRRSRRHRNKKRGGFYLSYIKYKIKYLELKKKLLDAENK